ncbi:MAG: selenocysteine-specific translation elongation factor [Streptosporangiaceae bacterium]|nr:selenocysteine-specific translation elongation factor [Streptosporangiaceae bacterium]
MIVVATAGHVDHGKSALVRALTGMEPDRWEEERRRGLTIDLGFAWLVLRRGQRVAFVDVPGHERFVPNMLAGVGPVPAVLFVVAADGGWMPQSAEHLAAIDAMGIRHGVAAITRSDLADPGPVMRQVRERLAATSLGAVEAVPVSAVTGSGLPELREAIARLAESVPLTAAGSPVRVWIDRSFSIKGSGTVVTGTLPAGTIRTGQELLLTPSLRPARIRNIESLGEAAGQVTGVARVALNLRGVPPGVPARGMALIEPGRWTLTTVLDVRLHTDAGRLPTQLTLHIGSARTVARVRPLGHVAFARLTLRDPLPLHAGDRVLLRDPGAATPTIIGATILDVIPPSLTRRGAAAAAARELSTWPDMPTAVDLLRRHSLLKASTLRAMGIGDIPAPVTGEWLINPIHWQELQRALAAVVKAHAERNPLAPGMPVEAARAALRLPDRALVEALAGAQGPVSATAGLLYGRTSHPPGQAPHLPPHVMKAVQAVLKDLSSTPFAAPEAGRLKQLGLDTKAIAAAARTGLLLRVNDQIVLAPGADKAAANVLSKLAQPFTTADARQALGTTRRVAIPLLEYLDRARITERLPDDRRRIR